MQPPAFKHEWTVRDGSTVTIRPIRPEDRDIEQAFVSNLSPNSRYLRFFSAVRDLSPQMLDRFTHVDYPRQMALIATVQAEGKELEIGVARYAPGSSGNAVEFAVVVADEWQGLGIGRELLRHLFDTARLAGFERIEGLVLKSNKNMLQLCNRLGFTVNRYPDDAALVRVVKEIGNGQTIRDQPPG